MSTLASNDSTISEEVPIEYENKLLSMMLLKIIMREEYMLVGVAIISGFLSMCLKL